MNYLQYNNYIPITFLELVNYLNNGIKPPKKAVVITFDDGRKDNFQKAFPILKNHSFNATFFIVTNNIIDSTKNSTTYMNVSEVQQMYAAGMDIPSHTRTHPDLTSIKCITTQ